MSAPIPSKLDHQQCIQGSFDESTGRLRVDAAISASIIAPPGLEVSIQAIYDNIAIRNTNNNNELLINPDGSINVNASFSMDPNINLAEIAGTATSVGNGVSDNGTLRVAIASNNNPLAITQSTSPWVVSGIVTSNIGTTNGLALDSSLSTINTTLGSPFQTGGSIGNTSFGAIQSIASNLNATVVGPLGVALAKDSSLSTINTTLGTPMQNSGGSVTANAGTGTFAVSDSTTHTDLSTINTTLGSPFQANGNIGNTTFGATQSGTWNINNISGTVSLPTGASTLANQTTANTSLASIVTNTTGLATSSNQTNGTQKTQRVDGSGNIAPAGDTTAHGMHVTPGDGTNQITVKAASTAAIATDTSQVVALSPNSPTPSGTNIIGSLVANQSVNVAQIGGTNTVTAGVSGLQAIGGNIASGSSDSGNPVKIGGVYNLTLPTLTNGQRGDLQCDNRGRMFTSSSTSSYKYITGATTTVVKSGTGTLNTISFSPSSGTLTIYDNTAGSGTIIGVFSPGSGSSAMPITLVFNLIFTTGLTIVTTNANQNVTITYS